MIGLSFSKMAAIKCSKHRSVDIKLISGWFPRGRTFRSISWKFCCKLSCILHLYVPETPEEHWRRVTVLLLEAWAPLQDCRGRLQRIVVRKKIAWMFTPNFFLNTTLSGQRKPFDLVYFRSKLRYRKFDTQYFLWDEDKKEKKMVKERAKEKVNNKPGVKSVRWWRGLSR